MRHVVMCLLIAALKDKTLIFASDVVNDLSTSVFLFRDNGRVWRERKAHFCFFSSTLFYVTSWFMESRSSLIKMSVCAARIMDYVFSPNSKSSTSSWNLLQDDPIFSSSSFPHVKFISLRWCIYGHSVEEVIMWSNIIIKSDFCVYVYFTFPKSA